MRNLTVILILTAFLFMPSVSDAAKTSEYDTSDLGFTIHTLDNGMTVVLKEVHAYPAVHFNTWIRVGSRNEMPDEYGIAHFLEHMIFNGNTAYTIDEMNDALYSVGAYDNASTSYDHTHYRTTIPSSHFNLGLDIHVHMIMEPLLTEESFMPEREVVKEESKMREDRPGTMTWEASFNNAFNHTGYVHPIIGYVDVIDEMDVDLMRAFQRRFYYPSNMVLIIAGDFDSTEALSKIKDSFGRYSNPEYRGRARRNNPDTQSSPRFYDLTGDISGCLLDGVFKGSPITSDETYALDVMMTILGDGDSARLAKKLKNELGIAHTAGAYNYSLLDGSSLGIAIEYTDPDDSEVIIAEMINIIEKFKANGPTDLELDKAKRRLISQQVFASEDLDGMCRYLGYSILKGGVDMAITYLDKVNSVTKEQVMELANRYLSRDNFTLAIMRPHESDPFRPDLNAMSTARVRRGDFGFGEITSPLPFRIGSGGGVVEDINHTTLPNGLEIWHKPNGANPTVAIDLYVEGGLAWESLDTNGACQVMQKSLMQGTTSRTREQINEELDFLGGSISVDSYRDFLAIKSMFLSSDFKRGFHLFADIAGYPLLDDEGIDKAREEVVAQVTSETNDMFRVAFDSMRWEIYGDHPYGRPYKGSLESLADIDDKDVRELYRKAYQPQNMHLVVAGDIDFDQLVDTAKKYFGGRPMGSDASPEVPAVNSVPNPGEKIVSREKSQVMITIGRPTLDIFSDELPAMTLMNVILGGSSYSRLYDEVREKRGYAYSVFSFQQAGLTPALWTCYLGTSPDNYPDVVDLIYEVINDLIENGVTEDEVQKAKDYYIGREYLRHIGNEALAFYIGQNVVVGLEPDREFKLLENIAQLSVDDIITVAEEYLDTESMAVVAAGKV